jgi:hypothetical protein
MEESFESRLKELESKNSEFILKTKNEADVKVSIIDKKAREDKRVLENRVSVISKSLLESN